MDSWNFFFQSLPRHLADTVKDVKNQPHSRWKIVFLIFQRKLPKFKKMSLASKNTLETEYFMPLNHFSNFSNFRGTQHFMRFWGTFLNAKTRGVEGWIWHFWGRGFDGDVQNCVLVEFGVANTIKKWRGLAKTSRFFVFFLFF